MFWVLSQSDSVRETLGPSTDEVKRQKDHRSWCRPTPTLPGSCPNDFVVSKGLKNNDPRSSFRVPCHVRGEDPS